MIKKFITFPFRLIWNILTTETKGEIHVQKNYRSNPDVIIHNSRIL